MLKFINMSAAALLLAACGGGDTSSSTSDPDPYVAVPIADLEAGTALQVLGNHTGIWRTFRQGDFRYVHNDNGPKLQRLDITENPNEFEAVFRNNMPGFETFYGKAVFIMPEDGQAVSGITSEGYEYIITRSNAELIYTLTGLFQIQTGTEPPFLQKYAHGGFVAGSVVPLDGLPTSGSATYSGDFVGYSTAVAGEVTGTFEMSADFAASADVIDVNGTIGDLGNGINDLTIRASINDEGGFDGGVFADAGTGVGNDFENGADGAIDGSFFGPNAEEVGGTIRINSADNYLTGSFGGSQD